MIRLAFTIDDGPNAGLTSGGWRVWVHGDSTYIASRGVGGIWKASLHGDTAWQVAVTKEHLASEKPVYAGNPRAPWVFQPTPFVDGLRLAFVIAITRPSLMPGDIDAADFQVPVRDRWDELTVAYVHMTQAGAHLGGSRRVIAEPLSLDSGRQVWVTWGRERVEPVGPERAPAGAMVEPVWPEQHGVAAPGFVLRGVHVG